MKNKQHHKLTPTKLRLILIVVMFLITGLSIMGFSLLHKKLATYAIEVSHKRIDANASKASLQSLQSIEKQLAADTQIIEDIKTLRHSGELPQFKAIEDLKMHASINDISISDISFSSTPTAGDIATTPEASTPIAPSAGDASNGVDIAFKISGGQVNVVNLINFLYDVEHSTPKLQIDSLSLTKSEDKRFVTIDGMTIKMFTK